MRKLFTKSSLCINAGSTVSGISDHEEVLQVSAGKIWVTIEGSLDDHWLSVGDTLTVAPGRLIVIEADKLDSRVNLPATHGAKRSFDFFASLRRSVSDVALGKEQACA